MICEPRSSLFSFQSARSPYRSRGNLAARRSALPHDTAGEVPTRLGARVSTNRSFITFWRKPVKRHWPAAGRRADGSSVVTFGPRSALRFSRDGTSAFDRFCPLTNPGEREQSRRHCPDRYRFFTGFFSGYSPWISGHHSQVSTFDAHRRGINKRGDQPFIGASNFHSEGERLLPGEPGRRSKGSNECVFAKRMADGKMQDSSRTNQAGWMRGMTSEAVAGAPRVAE